MGRSFCSRIAALLGVLVILAAEPAAGERRWSVRVDEPFEIDGTLYPPGTLVLEHRGPFTPTASFTEVWVDRTCLGLLRAERIASRSVPTQDRLIFERAAAGHLVLVGYASPAHDVDGEFRFPGSMGTSSGPLVASR